MAYIKKKSGMGDSMSAQIEQLKRLPATPSVPSVDVPEGEEAEEEEEPITSASVKDRRVLKLLAQLRRPQ